MNNQLLLLLLFVLLSLELLCLSKQKWLQRLLTGKPQPKSPRKPRVYKPKSEKDCPCCQAAHAQGTPVSAECSHAAPIPWSQRKGGRKKTISTQGYFCSNRDCGYFGVEDESIHALVGYGRHGRHEEIQDLRCQACDQKFTVRRHTPLYRLKTHSPIVSLSLQLFALGVDTSALQETLNIREATLRTWLVRSGGGQPIMRVNWLSICTGGWRTITLCEIMRACGSNLTSRFCAKGSSVPSNIED